MSEPIRVLCVFSTLNQGGAETMCMNLYRNLNRKKIQFDFVKHTPEIGAFETEILSLGGQIYQAPRFAGYNYLAYKRWWKTHLINHSEHRIIHGHFFTISSIYFKIAQDMGCVTVGHIHASKSDGYIKEYLVKKVGRYSNYRFACSQEAGKWAYGKQDFQVLHNALDVNEYQINVEVRDIMRRKLGLENNLVIGTVANLSIVKNPYGLLDIFNKIHQMQDNAKLLWVGDGPLRNEVEMKIATMGLTDSVVLLGRRNDVSRILQAMDAFVLPSFNEGLPVSLVEAQVAGLHCFVSDSITRETDVAGLCRYIPLNDYTLWAKTILSTNLSKVDSSRKICEAGYEITDSAMRMQTFYCNVKESINV